MFEVHTGGRPGRPALLLVLTALVLLGTLGLAWGQSRQLRELAPERRIPDTPLVVRPPPHWMSTASEPNVFRLLREGRTLFGRAWRTERAVRFDYRRIRGRADLATVVAQLEFDGELPPDAKECTLAGLTAREWRVVQRVSRQAIQERALRAALTPENELIVVEYLPSDRMSAREVTLMDDMCRAVRIDRGSGPSRASRNP